LLFDSVRVQLFVGSNFVVVLVQFKNAFSRHKSSPVATQSDCICRLFA
jgi:hypothetical protein